MGLKAQFMMACNWPAKSVVNGLALTDTDYDLAVGLLRSRYAKPGVIRCAHISELINIAPVFNEKSVKRLRNLRDKIETKFRGMEAQEASKESYSSVIIIALPALLSSLWNSSLSYHHPSWTQLSLRG